ncbi:MAG: KpsF/GutQ family sugar-phosphate isomerase [Saprospiraceae bacterium]
MINKIKNTAINTIQIEAKAIASLTESINEDFVNAVQIIASSKGRLIVTGIGKSAIVGQKIVATLNSTGTPSIFMHAADAIHGDLGMIQDDDVVLCLSKSGETSEIKVLVPFIKNLGNQIVAIVSNKNSYLAQQADFILHTPIEQEADPNNLAPTTSTTAQIVMGDALATSLLAVKGFTPKDFAKFHPGGTLGKQMYLRVSDLYPKNEQPKVDIHTALQPIILEISSKRLGMTAVLDNEKLVGIITDGDLRRMLNQKRTTSDLTASDIMTAKPKTIDKHALAVNALELMREQSITQLIVMDDMKYVGVIHLHDLIREGLV